jgi:hypothetical protein
MFPIVITVLPQQAEYKTIIEEAFNIYASIRSVVETNEACHWYLNLEEFDLDAIDAFVGYVKTATLRRYENQFTLNICFEDCDEDDNGIKTNCKWIEVILTEITIKHGTYPHPLNRPQPDQLK